MRKILLIIIGLFFLQNITIAQLTSIRNGGSLKASVSERIGLTDVTINYSRPGVKGREGKIWGQLVPFGFTDPGFGTSKAAPWRAGANENTTIEFSTDVKIDGNNLPAGKYGFFIAVEKDASTLIFSKNNSSWGSFFYNKDEDALRVSIKQNESDKSVEWLKYEFVDQSTNKATIVLQWEKWSFPFTVETEINKTQIQIFRNELRGEKGFEWSAWVEAANWCADNNTNLEEGLQWAEYAVSGVFVGQKNFRTLSAKSRILNLMGKTTDAETVMKEALDFGSAQEVHIYARQLQTNKKSKEAVEVFTSNYKKYPNQFVTNVGMARAKSIEGNYKEALKYANAALLQVPDPVNKSNIEAMIEKLKAGKDVN